MVEAEPSLLTRVSLKQLEIRTSSKKDHLCVDMYGN